MANVPTDRRAIVKVLLRGGTPFGNQPHPGPVQRRVGGYMVIVLGEAKREDWPGTPLRLGDVEGLVWTTPRQVPQVIANLRAVEGILDARAEPDAPR